MHKSLLIPAHHVAAVCRPGDRENCCAFIASDAPPSFFCAKGDPLLVLAIRERLAEGSMGARGDNCSGPPDYTTQP